MEYEFVLEVRIRTAPPNIHVICYVVLLGGSMTLAPHIVLCALHTHALEDTGLGGEKRGKLYRYKEIFFGAKILAMIRHTYFQLCGAHFYIQRSISSVPVSLSVIR